MGLPARADFSGVASDVELVGLWLAGRPASTVAVYTPVVEAFLARVNKPLRDLTAADCIAWQESLVGAEATRARWTSTVKSLLSFAWRTGYTTVNVGRILRCVKVADRLHEKAIEEEAVRALIGAADPGHDRTLVRLLYTAGLRISEAVGLRYIDLGKGRITVLGKGHKIRTIVVPEALVDDLRTMRTPGEPPTALVFRGKRGGALNVRDAREIVYRAAEASGLTLSPHWLRHAHASHALDHGCPIHVLTASLGHANVATTSRYLHCQPNKGASQYLNV